MTVAAESDRSTIPFLSSQFDYCRVTTGGGGMKVIPVNLIGTEECGREYGRRPEVDFFSSEKQIQSGSEHRGVSSVVKEEEAEPILTESDFNVNVSQQFKFTSVWSILHLIEDLSIFVVDFRLD